MEYLLLISLALLVPIGIIGLLVGAWMLWEDRDHGQVMAMRDRLVSITVCAIGTFALGSIAVVAAVLAAATR